MTQELLQFQTALPEAEARSERVDRLIDYLHDKRTHDGQSVFIIFMNTLCIYFSENDDLHVRLRSLCMDIEVEYFCQSPLSISTDTAFSVNMPTNLSTQPEMLIKLTKHFLKFRYLRNQHLRKEIINLLPREITRGISYNGQTSEIGASIQLVQACTCSPDGLEKLAYALYQKEGITPQWSELDTTLRDISKTVVTYTRLQQLQSHSIGESLAGSSLKTRV